MLHNYDTGLTKKRAKSECEKEISCLLKKTNRRKLKKYSNNFNKMFDFFLSLQRTGIITFCGSIIKVDLDINGISAKECFRLYEDGFYKNGKPIITRHPNIFKSVLIGKKGWGLWADQWTDGIVEWSFTREEILNEFIKVKVEIPESFLKDFDNIIERKCLKRNLNYLNEIKNRKK